MAKLIALLAAVTCTFGNLAAYGQTEIKRLLAYSTIAQAGYMMMPVAAALLLVDKDPTAAEQAIAALAFYIGVYLFMKIGCFAVVALVRNADGSESIADYAGLVQRAPVVAISFVILLLSLIGIPPLGGFFAKFFVFASLYDAGLVTVLIVAGLNTALSLFYYMRSRQGGRLRATGARGAASGLLGLAGRFRGGDDGAGRVVGAFRLEFTSLGRSRGPTFILNRI